jgi:predicted nucleic acid-binding Zn ribbon protein
MPLYTYKCITCENIFELRHPYKDKIYRKPSCLDECNLQKIPSRITISREKGSGKINTGAVVKETIEDTRQELEELRKERVDYKS